jgi:hypothetical protein
LDLLPHAESDALDAQLGRLESFQELVRQQRQLLGPGRGRDIDGEHAAGQPAGLGAARDAVTEQSPPSVAIDGDLPTFGRNHAGAVEQLSQHLRA